jgi:hypothetical protein
MTGVEKREAVTKNVVAKALPRFALSGLFLLLLLFLSPEAAASAVMGRPDSVAKKGRTVREDGPFVTNAVDTVDTTATKSSWRTIEATMMRKKQSGKIGS